MLNSVHAGLEHCTTAPVESRRNTLIADHEVMFSRSMTEKIPKHDLIWDRLSEHEKVDCTCMILHFKLVLVLLLQSTVLLHFNSNWSELYSVIGICLILFEICKSQSSVCSVLHWTDFCHGVALLFCILMMMLPLQ